MIQRVHRRGTGHLVYEVEIPLEGVALLGEVTAHLVDERLTAVGETEVLATERHDVIARRIELRQGDVLSDLEERQQTVERLPLTGTADEVHARLELSPSAGEALQASAHLCPLFQNGHVEALSRQNHSARQAS